MKHTILEKLELNGSTILLYDWDSLTDKTSPRIWENVELFDETGFRVWTVNGMEKCIYWDNLADTFVGFRYKDKDIQLTSFRGNSYDLDLKTGRVKFSEFHK